MCKSYQKEKSYLVDLLHDFGIDASSDQAELLLEHLRLVNEKNQVVNLTRITDAHEAVIKHTIDSLLFIKAIPFDVDDIRIHFVDIGTGGGFPGIPLSIVTKWQGLLIDSVQKKIDAVDNISKRLGLGHISLEALRAEDLAKQKSNYFDLVVARAVADISVLMEYASPLLRANGYLCISKGSPSDDEFYHAEITEELIGFSSVSRATYSLPDSCGDRTLMLYQKDRQTSIQLPRRPGMALKRPLYLRVK